MGTSPARFILLEVRDFPISSFFTHLGMAVENHFCFSFFRGLLAFVGMAISLKLSVL
jgi:hypothetical protein